MSDSQNFAVRRLEAPDVHAMLQIIKDGRREHGLEQRSPAALQPMDYGLFEPYRGRRSAYFVGIVENQVVGGAGIAPLDSDRSVCELQKMYLRLPHRGLGIGRALLQKCVETALYLGYERCYAETVLEMDRALALYERHGFQRLAAPLKDPGEAPPHDYWLVRALLPPQQESRGRLYG